MALLPHEQALHLVKHAKNILVVTHPHASLDAQASVLAFGLLLSRWQKPHDLVIPQQSGQALPEFLPQSLAVRGEPGALRDLKLRLNVREVGVQQILQQLEDGVLTLSLIPDKKSWSEQDARLSLGEDRYDLIVAIDCPDRTALGALALEQADMLGRTPIINLDAHASNEYWGQVNLVDMTASSTSEALLHWIEQVDASVVDEALATCVLAGMIEQTHSFTGGQVTPRTLTVASHLMNMGARHGDIMRGLNRVHSLASLKLWGIALSRLEQDASTDFVWTALTQEDFLATNATPETLDGVFDALLQYAPQAKLVALMAHDGQGIRVRLHAQLPFSAAEFARLFGGEGTRERAAFTLAETSDLVRAKPYIVQTLATALKEAKR